MYSKYKASVETNSKPPNQLFNNNYESDRKNADLLMIFGENNQSQNEKVLFQSGSLPLVPLLHFQSNGNIMQY